MGDRRLLFYFLLLGSLAFLLLFAFPPTLFFGFFYFVTMCPKVAKLAISNSGCVVRAVFSYLTSKVCDEVCYTIGDLSRHLLGVLNRLTMVFDEGYYICSLFCFISGFSWFVGVLTRVFLRFLFRVVTGSSVGGGANKFFIAMYRRWRSFSVFRWG